MDAKAKVREWVDVQAAIFDAHQAGDTDGEARHITIAETIECELRAAGHNIEKLVCP